MPEDWPPRLSNSSNNYLNQKIWIWIIIVLLRNEELVAGICAIDCGDMVHIAMKNVEHLIHSELTNGLAQIFSY